MKKTYEIRGMHCAGCTSSVKKSLESVEGVREVDVVLLTEKAVVTFEDSEVSFEKLSKTVDDIGFKLIEPEEGKKIFRVDGMHCSACVGTVEKAIKKIEGVTGAGVNLSTGKVFVEGDLNRETIQEIIKSVKDSGYEISQESDVKEDQLEVKKKERSG